MRIQSPFEEKLNAITHAIGALFGIVALVLLIVFAHERSCIRLVAWFKQLI
jgi:hemolysin III